MYTNILHATDLSENHFFLCQQAAALAKKLQANLYLLHVIEPPTSLQIAQGLGFAEFDLPTKVKEDAEAVMAILGEALNIPLNQQFVEIGSIKTHVIQKAQTLGCELIVVGKHQPNNIPSFLESSAHHILEGAPCDVLVLK